MNTNKELMTVREHLVARENELIQNVWHGLSHLAMVVLLYLISKIQPKDKPDKMYRIDLGELVWLLRWTDARYRSLRDAMIELENAQWWIQTKDEVKQHTGFIFLVHSQAQTAFVDMKFKPACHAYIFGLKDRSDVWKISKSMYDKVKEEGEEVPEEKLEELEKKTADKLFYTVFPLENVLLIRHRYSVRLYELLKCYEHRGWWCYEINTGTEWDLQPRLARCKEKDGNGFAVPKSWKNWTIFREDVLNVAVAEINTYTDLKITYRAYKRDIYGRERPGIKSVLFRICRKTEAEMAAVRTQIDAAYEAYEEQMRRKNDKPARTEPMVVKDDALWLNIKNIFAQYKAAYEYPGNTELEIDYKKLEEDYREMVHDTAADDDEYFELDTEEELPF